MTPRGLPAVPCPRCEHPRTRVRYVRRAGWATVIRHRQCPKPSCRYRFKTSAPRPIERYLGADTPAA